MKRSVLGVIGVVCVGLLSGCGQSDKDAATEVAKQYVVGTWKQHCQLNHPDMGGSARDCDNDSEEIVWKDHPTNVESVSEWEDGYAVVIPDAKGIKDVMGLRKSGEEWKVAAYGTIDDEAAAQKDPACWALSDENGQDCQE